MDPSQIKKIQAMNRYKRRQFLDNLYFYWLIALTCSLFCCVTLCLRYLSSLLRVLISVHLSSKLLFIIGNLIIFFLFVNSRILSSASSSSSTCDVYYDEYIQSSQIPSLVVKKIKTYEKHHVVEKVDMTRVKELKSLDLKAKGRVEKCRKSRETKEEENLENEGDEKSLVCSSDELNKRADDFIARVNRQRKLDLSLLQYGSY